MEYETIHSKKLANTAIIVYNSDKEFSFDHIMRKRW